MNDDLDVAGQIRDLVTCVTRLQHGAESPTINDLLVAIDRITKIVQDMRFEQTVAARR